ncbi:MAG: helix-turn-helix domain-containing protein [Sphaerochaeta sp.]
MNSPEQLGKSIAFLRRTAGYTQSDLALRTVISVKAVSKWERGLTIPDIDNICKLAILLNTDAESLFSGVIRPDDGTWPGIIDIKENSSDVCLTSVIYDKSLSHYFIGYFLLLGIPRIPIICADLKS